jgi:hypothetical protein
MTKSSEGMGAARLNCTWSCVLRKVLVNLRPRLVGMMVPTWVAPQWTSMTRLPLRSELGLAIKWISIGQRSGLVGTLEKLRRS